MRISVVGGGRMGLPLAACFAKHGALVEVCDVNESLVQQLQRGACPYEEPGLTELMAEVHKKGRLTATSDTTASATHANAIVVIVPAHLTSERDIDFSKLQSAAKDIGKGLRRNTLVVFETTVSVGGTRRHLIPVLESASGMHAGRDFFVGYSPERVKANLVLSRLQSTPKVVGGLDQRSRELTSELYRNFLRVPVDNVGSIEAAEMTKLLGMIYRDVNIALANELAAFCELSGVDFEKIRASANSDGEANLLIPGIGVGGHCTPVYPYFLIRESRRLGLTQRLSEAAREINEQQPLRQLARLATHWSNLHGKTVHLLGLGFRPGVKVDAFSPAYVVRDILSAQGARVSMEDPYYSDEEIEAAGFKCGLARDSNAVVLLTAHPEFATPDFADWKQSGVAAVLDGRNLWDQEAVEAAGLIYFGVGRSGQPERR